MAEPSPDEVVTGFARVAEERRVIREQLKTGGGGGTSNDMSSDTLKARVDLLQAVVLILLTGLIAVAIGAATFITTSNNAISARVDKGNDATSGLNREVGTVSTKIDAVSARLEAMDGKLDQIAAKLNRK